MDEGLETEVKFAAQTLEKVRHGLVTAGAELRQPRTFEINLRLDDSQGSLRAAGKVLRLRQDASAWLTLKLPLGPWGTQAKTLREMEVEVSDLQVAHKILNGLGFGVWFRYEKYRESYKLGTTEVSLDELPFGRFVEIEGSLEGIEEAMALLGLPDAERITAGYYTLFHEAKDRLGLALEDCTFAGWAEASEGNPV